MVFCKPCFVLSFRCLQMKVAIICLLHQNKRPRQSLIYIHFCDKGAPTKFGFLTRGVYPFHSDEFPRQHRHCGTFKDTKTVPGGLGLFSAVNLLKVSLAYRFARRGHYSHLRLCEHGLSSTFLLSSNEIISKLQLPEYHHNIIPNFTPVVKHFFAIKSFKIMRKHKRVRKNMIF